MKSTRKEAIQAIEEWYYTGKPCRYGHLAKRRTMDGSCTACRYEISKKTRLEVRAIFKGGANG